MLPDKPTSAPAYTHWGILWLVVGHIAIGLMGAYTASLAGRRPSLWVAAFLGLMLSQTSFLGIWGGLGTSPWWKRLIGVVVGVSYLIPLLGIGIHEVDSATFIVVVGATSCVLTPLLIVRFFGVVIHLGSSPAAPAGRIQFSVRHLLILTFVIAYLVAIGRLIQPRLSHGVADFRVLLIVLTSGVVGILPVWFVLATNRPILYGIGVVTVGTIAGYSLGRGPFFSSEQEIWLTVTATEAMAVVVSLFAVRSCGYHVMRMSSRRQMEKAVEDAGLHVSRE